MADSAAEREARRKRAQAEARQAGNERARQRAKAPKVTIPETVESQVARAVANVNAAEAKRRGTPALSVVREEPVAPKAPTKTATRSRTTAKTAATAKPPANKKTRGSVERQPMADPHERDVAAAVSKMNIEHIQCRDFGHSWRPFHARWMPKENCYESQLRCARCSTVRTRWLSRTGTQIGGGYDYAEGYLVKGLGQLSGTDRDHIRLASVLSVLVDDTAEEA